MTLRRHLRVALRRRGALIVLSDFDGTLAPIADRPGATRLPPRARRLLARLARHPKARVGIVSGRSLVTLRRLTSVPRAAYAGCHGLEIACRGVRFRHPRAVALAPLLRRVEGELRRKTRRLDGVLVEWKGLTVSLHYRRADPAAVPALRALVREIAARTPRLEILRGRRVLELRPRVGWGKGRAVALMREQLAHSLGHRAPVTLYLGDDTTDEEAFRALGWRAVCVAVGRRRSRAPYRLRAPEAVADLLAWLMEALEAAEVRR